MAPQNGSKATFQFADGEAVLAFHGPLIYEAEIRESALKEAPDNRSKFRLHLLHYTGWDSHWDEWVPESRVMKNTQQNIERQKERVKEFQRAHKRKRAPDAKAADAKAAKGGGAASPKPASGVTDDTLCAEIREQLRLPHGAKLKLIEDWEHISREKKYVPLPNTTTSVERILADFLATKARRSSHERLYGEVCDGVKAYFNQALPTLLLYKFERRQFRLVKEAQKGAEPHTYYGAEHLLRLFVKMPELLARSTLPQAHASILVSKLAEMLKFIMSKKAEYFAAEYEGPDEEYLQWWASNSNE